MNDIDYLTGEIYKAYPGESDHDRRGRGDEFEKLTQAYLSNEPSLQLSNVSLWQDSSDETDTGIDIAADSPEGKVAIQCKFWKEGGRTLKYDDLKTFISEVLLEDEYKRAILVDTTGMELDELLEKKLKALKKKKPFTRITLDDLRTSRVDLVHHYKTGKIRFHDRKQLRPYQKTCIDKGIEHLLQNDRGKMIMACGTGKTFVSLRIAEGLVGKGRNVLFLVPSLALMSQAMEKWEEDGEFLGTPVPVCSREDIARDSDKQLAISDDADTMLADLNRKEFIHATTSPEQLAENFTRFYKHDRLNVVFCTYQSSKQIMEAQKGFNLPEFDLIICDEAHKTTGIAKKHQFTLVHDQEKIRGRKRLYMTATPRIIEGSVSSEAGVLYSMEDEDEFGKDFFTYGFTTAIEDGWLKQYKVVVLGLNEPAVPEDVRKDIDESDGELDLENYDRIIGCQKAVCNEAGIKRVLAFHQRIKNSSRFAGKFGEWVDSYNRKYPQDGYDRVSVTVEHLDGSDSVAKRNRLVNWLKGDVPDGECRMVSNARVFIEGVDVPSLNAIIFVQPKSAHADVIQSIGRVLRPPFGRQVKDSDKEEDKTGLVFIPIVAADGEDPHGALAKNPRYEAIVKVLYELALNDKLLLEKLKAGDLLKYLQVGKGRKRGPEEASDEAEKEVADEVSRAVEHIKTSVVKFRERIDKRSSTDYSEKMPRLFNW